MKNDMFISDKTVTVTTTIGCDEIVDFDSIKSMVNCDLAYKIRNILAEHIATELIGKINFTLKNEEG